MDPQQIVVYGLRSAFGGHGITGFALIYESIQAKQSFDAKNRSSKVRSDIFFN